MMKNSNNNNNNDNNTNTNTDYNNTNNNNNNNNNNNKNDNNANEMIISIMVHDNNNVYGTIILWINICIKQPTVPLVLDSSSSDKVASESSTEFSKVILM